MSGITAAFVRRPALATVVVLLTLVAGTIAYPGLVQQQFPNVDLPVIQVIASYPGASPSTIRDTVARPIEDQLAGAPDLDHIQTTIQQGGATVAAFFTLESDKTADLTEVQRRLQSADAQLPSDLRAPSIVSYDPSQGTVVELAVSTNRLSPHDLSNTVDNLVIPQMEQIPGVSFVQSSGDVTPSIEVAVDPMRLIASGSTLNDVISAVANNNVRAPGGIATAQGTETTLDVRGDIQTPQSVASLLLGSAAAPPPGLNPWSTTGRVLQIRDVASTSYGYETQRVFAFHRGDPAIILDVRKASGASEVSVSNAVLKALPDFRSRFPNVAFSVVNVQAAYTKEQIGEVWQALIEAIALTAIVMLFFLRSWRNALVVCVSIPTSLLVALTAMRLFNFTLDTVSLAAMTLVIGILVDDSTVVLENIERHRDAGEDAPNAAIAGRTEIALAAVTLTLVDVVVFLPLAFLPGTVGRFMKEFGLVVAIATITSLVISFTVTPAMAGCWSMFSHWKPWRVIDAFTQGFERVRTAYATRILPWALARPRGVAVVSAFSVVIALALVPAGLVGFEFLPAVDRGEVTVQVRYPVGTSLAVTRTGILALEQQIDGMPQVEGETAIAGSYQAQFGGFVQQGFVGQVHVFLRVDKHHSSAGWLRSLLPKAQSLLPNAAVVAIPATGINGGTQQPIDYVVDAPAPMLDSLARKVYATAQRTPGTANVLVSALDPMPSVDVTFDRDAAQMLGVSIGTAATAVRAAFGGVIATQYSSASGSQDVQVVYPFDERGSLLSLAAIPIRTTTQKIVHVGDVAQFISRPAAPLITRINRRDVVFVSSNVRPGYQTLARNECDRIASRNAPDRSFAAAGSERQPAKYVGHGAWYSGRARPVLRARVPVDGSAVQQLQDAVRHDVCHTGDGVRRARIACARAFDAESVLDDRYAVARGSRHQERDTAGRLRQSSARAWAIGDASDIGKRCNAIPSDRHDDILNGCGDVAHRPGAGTGLGSSPSIGRGRHRRPAELARSYLVARARRVCRHGRRAAFPVPYRRRHANSHTARKGASLMKVIAIAILMCFSAVSFAAAATIREQLKYQVVDSTAKIIVNRVQNESCTDFAATIRQRKGSGSSGGASGLLKRDPSARARFVDKVAGPLINKMIDCDLLPGK